MTVRQLTIEGRSWVFGDNMNTDLMYPSTAFRASDEERRWMVFEANRPGWSREVRDGDVIVGGANFGTGSGRPASKLFRDLGVACIVAESVNGLFLRNSINYGLPILECPGVAGLVTEGDVVSVDCASGEVRDVSTGASLRAEPLPPFLLDILEAGGVLPRLVAEGYVDA